MQSSLGTPGWQLPPEQETSPSTIRVANRTSPALLEHDLGSIRSGLPKPGAAQLRDCPPPPPPADTQVFVGIALHTFWEGQDGEPALPDSRATCCAVTGTLPLTSATLLSR